MLEPPGFMALHYGVQTPLAILLSHVVFGLILGGFYHLEVMTDISRGRAVHTPREKRQR